MKSAMNGLRLFTSNRLEISVEQLGQVLAAPLSHPLVTEVIVVESQGMAQWVSLQLALKTGITAITSFPFPNNFLNRLFRNLLTDLQETKYFEISYLTFKIMKILPKFLNSLEFELLRNYLEGEKSLFKLYQLSERLAILYDKYSIYRPELLLSWEESRAESWDAILWRDLIKDAEPLSLAHKRQRLLRKLKSNHFLKTDLPERISLFGISSLPLYYNEIFLALSQVIPVNFFLLNPCREYWDDIISDDGFIVLQRHPDRVDLDKEALHFETGNPLLASWGKLGRDYFHVFHELGLEETAVFEDPGAETLLARIQSDILNLQGEGENIPPQILSREDQSIQIHSCHLPLREVEILYDHVLDFLNQDPNLQPRDILVMTPDIETYAPFVEAVFGVLPDQRGKISFQIIDYENRPLASVVDTFFSLLELGDSGLEADRVYDFLNRPAVYKKFDLSYEDLRLIHQWIQDNTICFAEEQVTQSKPELVKESVHTWQAGRDRILLGSMMPGDGWSLYEGMLPYDGVEGERTVTLGRFLNYLELLIEFHELCTKSFLLSEWSKFFINFLEKFFLSSREQNWEIQKIREVCYELEDILKVTGYGERVAFDIVRSYLRKKLEKFTEKKGLVNGGVTFCTMKPMRSLPFKVICLMGMQEGQFPRKEPRMPIDRTCQDPRPGDRSNYFLDRYIFLEALLSARKKFYISYIGQDLKNDKALSPSPLVSELLEYIENRFIPADKGQVVRSMLMRTHRLHPFHPQYFGQDPNLFSYSDENCQACRVLTEKQERTVRSINLMLPETPIAGERTVTVKDLCQFFSNPAKYFLKNRLGVRLEENDNEIKVSEPLFISGLERYKLDEGLMKWKLAGHSSQLFYQMMKAAGRLPGGSLGQYYFSKSERVTDELVKAIKSLNPNGTVSQVPIDLKVGSYRLQGEVPYAKDAGILNFRPGQLRPADRIKLWIHHLCFQRSKPDALTNSYFVAKKKNSSREEVPLLYHLQTQGSLTNSLEELIALFDQGCRRVLPFFPEISYVFAENDYRGRGVNFQKIREQWLGSKFKPGEGEDPYVKLCFKEGDPLNDEFKALSLAVYRQILECQQEHVL